MRESILETIIGAAVLVVAGVFLWFAMARGGEAASAPSGSVELGARFNSVSGVSAGTDVRMAGVKVGTVRKVGLDVERAEALVTMAISKDLIPLEDGTSARIQAEGLLGGNYINLEPAAGFGTIEPCPEGEKLFGDTGCGEILYTQGSVDLLTLFASFASGAGSDDSADASTSIAAEEEDPSPFDTLDDDEGEESTDADTESPDSSASIEEDDQDQVSPGDE